MKVGPLTGQLKELPKGVVGREIPAELDPDRRGGWIVSVDSMVAILEGLGATVVFDDEKFQAAAQRAQVDWGGETVDKVRI